MKQTMKIIIKAEDMPRRNPVAASLADSQFRPKTVPNKKAYRRRGRTQRSWD